MEENQENQNECYKSLNAKILLADDVIEEAYKNQIKIVEQQQRDIENMGITESISFVNIVPGIDKRLLRRKGFVIGFNEILTGQESKQLREEGVLTKEQDDIYSSVEVCENPLGYTSSFSVKFPKGKNRIIIDSEKGESVPINSENLEKKLKEQDLNPSLVRESQTKYNEEKWKKEQIYQIFFNYTMSEKEIDDLKTIQPEDIKEIFRIGIRKPLEEAINCIVNLELK